MQCKFSDTSLLEAVFNSFMYSYPRYKEISTSDLYTGMHWGKAVTIGDDQFTIDLDLVGQKGFSSL